MTIAEERTLQRRVAGYHDIRMDGMLDLVIRAKGATVMDVGCNRGLVGFEFANQGASLVHGCDNYLPGIETARQLFADLRNVTYQFECVDLTLGPSALKPFGRQKYDIMLVLATCHKLRRLMLPELYSALVRDLAGRTTLYFAWRATSDKPSENMDEMKHLDVDLKAAGAFKRIHTSEISRELGIAAIWRRDT